MKRVSSSVPSLEQRHRPVSRRASVARRQRRDSGVSTSRCPVVCPVVPSLFRPTDAYRWALIFTPGVQDYRQQWDTTGTLLHGISDNRQHKTLLLPLMQQQYRLSVVKSAVYSKMYVLKHKKILTKFNCKQLQQCLRRYD